MKLEIEIGQQITRLNNNVRSRLNSTEWDWIGLMNELHDQKIDSDPEIKNIQSSRNKK